MFADLLSSRSGVQIRLGESLKLSDLLIQSSDILLDDVCELLQLSIQVSSTMVEKERESELETNANLDRSIIKQSFPFRDYIRTGPR